MIMSTLGVRYKVKLMTQGEKVANVDDDDRRGDHYDCGCCYGLKKMEVTEVSD